eukprot:Lithocolla_globosa_v1_NODE_634_length_3546_cov_7.930679.p1 type:complete len:296 gc:universal NODE_634_length_3546_cov_7.930679:1464-2351(+)
MLIVNKMAIRYIQAVFLLLILQTLATLCILYVQSLQRKEELPSLKKDKAISWLPSVTFFMLMLLTSLKSLNLVSVSTVIVFRNLNSLLVACGDYLILKREVTTNMSLLVIILGSIIYGYHDLNYDFVGYFWTFSNLFAGAAYSLYIKSLLDKISYTATEMSLYSNVMALPVWFLGALFLDDLSTFRSVTLHTLTAFEWTAIVASCFMAFAISVSGFWAQTVFKATTFITLNNVNKIPAIIISAWIFSDVLSLGSVVGLAVGLMGGLMYAMSSMKTKDTGGSKLDEMKEPKKTTNI